MKLTLTKHDAMGDWYLIERAEHDGREWLEQTGPNIVTAMRSSRFSDADVEGVAIEMKAIAEAIEKRGGASFKRCAVGVGPYGKVEFWSPRNSQKPGVVTLAEADDLARQIREMLP